MKLWLIRHACPLIAPGTCYGASDVPDDPAATAQAAAALAMQLPIGLRIGSSPLQRCEHLSQSLQGLRPDLIYRTDAKLAEMNFGTWEGQLWANIPKTELDTWTANFADHAVGGGESVRRFMRRVGRALAAWQENGADAAWICHAGVARAVMLLLAGVACPTSANDWPRTGLAFGGWEVVDGCQKSAIR